MIFLLIKVFAFSAFLWCAYSLVRKRWNEYENSPKDLVTPLFHRKTYFLFIGEFLLGIYLFWILFFPSVDKAPRGNLESINHSVSGAVAPVAEEKKSLSDLVKEQSEENEKSRQRSIDEFEQIEPLK